MTSNTEKTIDTRGITFTDEQMRKQRIKKICNVITERGTDDFKPMDYISSIQDENPGRNIFDAVTSDNNNIISLVVFDDIFSRNIFAIRNKDYYGFHPDLITLFN